jgi:hypothetical protein
MSSHSGFKWPPKGPVKCDDWKPVKACGNGLHGFLWGEGDGLLANFDESAKWLVVEVLATEIVDLKSKVKFPRGTVVFCGSRFDATRYIAERAPNAVKAIVGGTSTSGYGGTSTSGDMGTSTSGDMGTSTSGYGGTSTSGVGGTSTSGVGGTSTSGDMGTSTSGYGGTSTSGVGGEIRIRWWDDKTNRHRTAVGYIGEDGLLAGVAYFCREGKFYRKDGKDAAPAMHEREEG